MTPQLLERDLVEDLHECLDGMLYQDVHGKLVPLKVFRHDVPIPHHKDYTDLEYNDVEKEADPESPELYFDSAENTEDDAFPYVIVRLSQGNVKNPDEPQLVTVNFIIGVYDPDERHRGHDGVMNIISRIYERYAKNPIVHGSKAKIHFDGEQLLFHWVLQDDDTWPYYFGAVLAEFEIMPIERVSKYT